MHRNAAVLLCVFWFCLFRVAADAPATQPMSIRVKVVDDTTWKPIAGAFLSSSATGNDKRFTADADGVATIAWDKPLKHGIQIRCRHEGYARMAIRLSNDSKMPAEYTLAMIKAVPISGIVQSPDGKPVANASVSLDLYQDISTHESFLTETTLHTDADGKFKFNELPKSLNNLRLHAEHPDFAHQALTGNTFTASEESLRAGTAVLTLKKGIPLAGRVTDEKGNPIKGAKVCVGRDRVASNTVDPALTDEDGHYTWTADPEETLVLTVKADGFAPELRSMSPDEIKEPVDFKLSTGRVIRFRIQDAQGKALPDVLAFADTWRGLRTISKSLRSDTNGEVIWKDAPVDAVKFDFNGAGLNSLRHQDCTARDEPYVITMTPELKATISVSDADTGKPIESFDCVRGLVFNGYTELSWEARKAVIAKDGKHVLDCSEPYAGYAVRIIADGYARADSRIFKQDEGSVTLEFKLKPAEWTKVAIRTPDGQPATSAQVIELDGSGTTLFLYNARIYAQDADSRLLAKAGADGIASAPRQQKDSQLLIIHESGFLRTHVKALSGELTLMPYAKLEGTVKIGSKVAASIAMTGSGMEMAEDRHHTLFMVSYSASTDSNGHFAIDRVLPGEVVIGREVRPTPNSSTATSHERLDLKPGERATVNIGGKGRPVVGRVDLPQDMRNSRYTFENSLIRSVEVYPDRPEPKGSEDWEPEKLRQWYDDWMKTPDGIAYKKACDDVRNQSKSFPIVVAKDGSFRVEDVPQGNYRAQIEVSQVPENSPHGFGEQAARGSAKFTVDDIPGGQSDEALEVPTITIARLQNLKVGDIAPDFEVTDLNGETFKLSTFKGKYVLVDFWATWCGPCVAEMPHQKEIAEAFKDNPNFVMIGLSLDRKIEHLQKYVAAKQITWRQAFLGDNWSSGVVQQYGVQGIPSVFLIGPDGKVISKSLRGESAKDTIKQELQKLTR